MTLPGLRPMPVVDSWPAAAHRWRPEAAWARRLCAIVLGVVLAGCGGGSDLDPPGRKQGLSTPATLLGSTPGARQLFGQSAAPEDVDLDGDGKADLLWYNPGTGATVAWLMDGISLRGGGDVLGHPSYRVTGTADLDGDGRSDLIWHDPASGETTAWLMNGSSLSGGRLLLRHPDYVVIGAPDLNGDGKADLLWRNPATGQIVAWLMDGTNLIGGGNLLSDPAYRVVALPDLNGDGKTDLLWHNAGTGETVAWLMDGMTILANVSLLVDAQFRVTATPDLNGDGKSDLLWRNPVTGQTVVWLMNGVNLIGGAQLLADPDFSVVATADLNGDRKADLLWRSASSPQTVAWLMDGVTLTGGATWSTVPDLRLVGTSDLNGDGRADLQWYSPQQGRTVAWLMDGLVPLVSADVLTSVGFRPFVVPTDDGTPGPGFSLGGSIAGLSRSGLRLQSNGQTLDVAANETRFRFATALANGTPYSVVVLAQPPGQACTVGNGTGTVSGGNVDNVSVTCVDSPPRSVVLTGPINGLASTGLRLSTNGQNFDPGPNTGSFFFQLPEGTEYNIVVANQPLNNDCRVDNGRGFAGVSPVDNLAVTCLVAMRDTWGDADPNFGGGDSGAAGAGGSAGDGAPIVGARVEVYGVVQGVLVRRDATALTDASGRFKVRIDNLLPPMLAVVYDPATNNLTPKWYSLSMDLPKAREFVTLNLSGLTDALVSGVSNNIGLCGSTSLKDQLASFMRTSAGKDRIEQNRDVIRLALAKRIKSWDQDGSFPELTEAFDPVYSVLDIRLRNFHDQALDRIVVRRKPDQLVDGNTNNLSANADPSCKTQIAPQAGFVGIAADF